MRKTIRHRKASSLPSIAASLGMVVAVMGKAGRCRAALPVRLLEEERPAVRRDLGMLAEPGDDGLQILGDGGGGILVADRERDRAAVDPQRDGFAFAAFGIAVLFELADVDGDLAARWLLAVRACRLGEVQRGP